VKRIQVLKLSRSDPDFNGIAEITKASFNKALLNIYARVKQKGIYFVLREIWLDNHETKNGNIKEDEIKTRGFELDQPKGIEVRIYIINNYGRINAS